MLKLDNSLLDEIGLGGLPEDQKRAMLQHIYETLELRVGTQLANQMSDEQLEEFEKFIDEGGDANQAQALQWLETNLPNYKQVVNEVFEALKVEVKNMAPQLLGAATAAPMPGAADPAGQVPASAPAAQPYADPYGAPAPAAPAYGQPATYGQPPAPAPASYAQPPAAFGPPAAPSSGPTYGAPAPAWPAPAANGFDPMAVPPLPADPAPPAAPAGGSFADPAAGAPFTQPQPGTTATDSSAAAQNSPFPPQQPPAGPGSYPSQHSAQ